MNTKRMLGLAIGAACMVAGTAGLAPAGVVVAWQAKARQFEINNRQLSGSSRAESHFVHNQKITHQQSVFHGPGGDHETLYHKGADQKKKSENQNDLFDNLPHTISLNEL